jgi:hypothetical protein
MTYNIIENAIIKFDEDLEDIELNLEFGDYKKLYFEGKINKTWE